MTHRGTWLVATLGMATLVPACSSPRPEAQPIAQALAAEGPALANERAVTLQQLKKLGFSVDRLERPLGRITVAARAGRIDEAAIRAVVAMAADATAASSAERLLRSYADSVRSGRAHLGPQGGNPLAGGAGTPAALVRSAVPAAAGQCRDCPDFDFGPFQPTLDFATHAAALGPDPGDCNRYLFDVTPGHQYEFTTCAPGAIDFDTMIEVGDQDSCGFLDGNDDSCGVGSRVVVVVPMGVTRLNVQVNGFAGTTGRYSLAYREVVVPTCASCAAPRPGLFTPGPECATIPGTIGSCQDNIYQFALTGGVTYEFSTCASAACAGDAALDTTLEIYGPGCQWLDYNDDSQCWSWGTASRLRFTPGTSGTYRVAVRGFAGQTGDFVLAYREAGCSPAGISYLVPSDGWAGETCGVDELFVAGIDPSASSGNVSFQITAPPGGAADPAAGTVAYEEGQSEVGHLSSLSYPGLCGGASFEVAVTARAGCSADGTELRQSYTLRDPLPPLVTCAESRMVSCSDPAINTPEPASAVDNCDAAPAVSLVEEVIVPPEPGTPVCAANFDLIRSWAAEDCSANRDGCTQRLPVRDLLAPTVTPGSHRCIWPPDHRLVCFTVAELGIQAVDDCGGASEVTITRCSSSQPDNGVGDGDTGPDCTVLDGGRGVCVRAERQGNERGGRLYTIEGIARDECGNATLAGTLAQISVPHDQGGRPVCEAPPAPPAFGRERDEEDVQRRAWGDDAVYARLSSGARTLLDAKFGRRPRSDDPPAIEPALPGSPEAVGPPANVLANDPSLDLTAQDTQSETALVAGAGPVIIAAFNDSAHYLGQAPYHFTGWSRSVDGGASFVDRGRLPDHPNGDAGDPCLARDATGGVIYFSTLCFNGSCLQVFRSLDNGATFAAPVNAAPGTSGLNDKEWIAVDNFPGPGQGNVYVAWRNFYGSNGILFTRSTNRGASFGPTGGLYLASGGQGAFVTVGRDHAVYVFWYTGTAIMVRKSTNQGVSFGAPVLVASLLGRGTNGDLALAGGFRSNSFPHAAVNPVTGDLYVVYNDCSSSYCPAAADHGNVFLRRSADGGLTWSAAVRVNDDASVRDQFVPTIAVAPSGKQLMVSFYDRRLDPANRLIDRFFAIGDVGADGSVALRPNQRLSSASFPAVRAQDPVINATYMGDYDMLVGSDSGFYGSWGDNRLSHLPFHANQPDVRVAKVESCTPPIVGTPTVSAAELWPPNHQMVGVDVRYDVTANCPAKCTLGLTSDEGTNEHEPDMVAVDAHRVQLRAERDGDGDGRVYRIAVTCTNSAGSASRATAVTVPHDQRH